MCHHFICTECGVVSWDFCYAASDFYVCPFYTKTTYKTDRRCEVCIRISCAIDELSFWLAGNPQRALHYEAAEGEEDETLSVKSFYDTEDEAEERKRTAEAASPWGDHSEGTSADENKENICPEEKEGERCEESESTIQGEDEAVGNQTISLEESVE